MDLQANDMLSVKKDQELATLRQDWMALSNSYNEKSKVYGPDSAILKSLKTQMDDTAAKIKNQINANESATKP